MDSASSRSVVVLLSTLISQTLTLLLLLPGGCSAVASSAAPLLLGKRKRSDCSSDPESDLSETRGPSLSASGDLNIASPDQFPLSFRMSSSTFEWLTGLLEPLLDSGPGLRPSARLAVGLFRLATGCPYTELAAMFGVSEPAARSCAKRLCRVLCTNFRFWLAFPASEHDLRAVSDTFRSIPGGFAGCCGAIVSTRCGKVAMQVVADGNCRILSVSTGCGARKVGAWRGLRCSSLYRDVEDGKLLGSGLFLVAGNGYPLLRWLMVPFSHAEDGSKEEAFNEVHRCMLGPAHRTVRSLRSWGVLGREMVDEEGRMRVACIGTCAILHNMLLMREDYSALSSELEDCFVDDGNGCWGEEDGGLGEIDGAKEAADLRSELAEKAKDWRDSKWSERHQ